MIYLRLRFRLVRTELRPQPARRVGLPPSLPFAQEITPEEEDLDGLEIILVGLPGEAVALVLADDVPDGHAVLLHGRDDLLGFRQRHAGVVLPLHDEDRRVDLARARQRRDPLEELAHLRVALIAVFGPP